MARKLKTATNRGNRLDQLKTLARILAEKIDSADEKNTAQLAKQYRETIAEIEMVEGKDGDDDELSDILRQRSADGKSGAVREDISKLS